MPHKVYELSELMHIQFPPVREYVKDLIPIEGKTVIFGRFKSGKSQLVIQMLTDMIQNKKVLGYFDIYKPADVLYVENELPFFMVQDRMKGLGINTDFNSEYKAHIMWAPGLFINMPDGQTELKYVINETKAKIVFIDSLYAAVAGTLSKEEVTQQVTNFCDTLIGEFGVSVVLCHHQRKVVAERGDQDMEEMLGSILLPSWVDGMFRIKAVSPTEVEMTSLLRYKKSPHPITIGRNPENNFLHVDDSAELVSKQFKQEFDLEGFVETALGIEMEATQIVFQASIDGLDAAEVSRILFDKGLLK